MYYYYYYVNSIDDAYYLAIGHFDKFSNSPLTTLL